MRDEAAAFELVLPLEPGLGLHQPANAPHWVETHDSVSVSYAFGIETRATRSAGQTWRFNHYLRKLGRTPQAPGADARLDGFKALCMGSVSPLIPMAVRLRNSVRGD